jgi:iron complex transport system substrate-binding protein
MTPQSAVGRRTFLAGLGALSVATLVGCNASAGGTGSEAGPSGASSFSYTDARGKVVEFTLPASTVVAQSSVAATLLDFGYQVAGAYGDLKPIDGKLSYQAGSLDPSTITVLADAYGQFDVEKFAALNPQVLIDLMFVKDELWYLPDGLQAKVEAVSPTIGMEMLNLNLLQIIENFAALAAKLGADITAPAVTEAKADFEAAVAKVRAAVAAKPDLTVLGISRSADKIWVANAAQHPDFAYLETLGVRFVDAKVSDPSLYFNEVSYERLDEFSGDVIFDDSRGGVIAAADKQPTWRALPAVKAGQVHAWKPAAPYSYTANAPILTEFADALSGATKAT